MIANCKHIPLCCPSWDQREALRAGAITLNGDLFAPQDAYLDDFWNWLPRRFKPEVKAALLPSMLPVTAWDQNVRAVLGPQAWDTVRKHCYRAAGFRCEICGEKGKLEAHELFSLDTEKKVQKLTGLIALCPLCHKAHHLGYARRLNILPQVLDHICKVNNWTQSQLDGAVEEAYINWAALNQFDWTLDLTFLQKNGTLYA